VSLRAPIQIVRAVRRASLIRATCFAARAKVSGRRSAAGNLAELGVIAGGHASNIAAEIFVALSGGTQRRVEKWAQRAGNAGEHRCIGAARFAAHEER